DKRIRLEHGHIYDEMYVKYPRTYSVMTALGSMMLRVSPSVFWATVGVNSALISLGEWRHSSLKGTDDASRLAREIPGERASFMRAAVEISERGFDAVIFGHTHRPGEVELPNGARYY